jgi:hypothetical protein
MIALSVLMGLENRFDESSADSISRYCGRLRGIATSDGRDVNFTVDVQIAKPFQQYTAGSDEIKLISGCLKRPIPSN